MAVNERLLAGLWRRFCGFSTAGPECLPALLDIEGFGSDTKHDGDKRMVDGLNNVKILLSEAIRKVILP